ncbi:MAG: sporulation integral membrane protein YtvI [Lachnospiraceae bacterium]|jgi:sporulation integral membrane protein YtvI
MKKYIKSLIDLLLTIIGIILVIAVALWGLDFFMPFVIGWIVSMIANPLVRFAESKLKIVRKHTSMVIIILVLGIILGAGYLVGAKVVREVVALVQQAPEISQSLSGEFQDVQKNLALLMMDLPENVRTYLQDFGNDLGEKLAVLTSNVSQWTVSWASGFAKRVPSMLIAMIFTILSAYFFIVDRDKILEFGRKNTPLVIQRRWKLLADNFLGVLGGYMKAQLKIMLVVWVLLTAGFFVLGIGYAIPVAFLVSLCDMLPFLGTGTILIPWAIFKVLSGDVQIALGLIIIYGITQLVRRLIEPKLVGDSIGVNPLATLIFMYAGYKWFGVLGMILAVPIGAIMINFYRMGMFDHMLAVLKEAVEDFYYWLRPQEKENHDTEIIEEEKENKG